MVIIVVQQESKEVKMLRVKWNLIIQDNSMMIAITIAHIIRSQNMIRDSSNTLKNHTLKTVKRILALEI